MLPGSRRANVRKHLRRLDEGKVTLRMVTDPKDLDGAVRRWHALHLKRWEGLAEPINPMHPTSAFRDFMLDAMRALVPRDLASVWEFLADGEVVGAYLNLIDDESFYWYLGGFEPRSAALGIGKLSIAQGIRWSIETGRSYFDLTRGVESFKYYFGAMDRECASVLVRNELIRSRAAFAADELGRRARAAVRDVQIRLRERRPPKPVAGAPPEHRPESAGAPSTYRERVSIPR
jgi:CelD/BcsL family acetyltransferase involved in cellulose biosynthesis